MAGIMSSCTNLRGLSPLEVSSKSNGLRFESRSKAVPRTRQSCDSYPVQYGSLLIETPRAARAASTVQAPKYEPTSKPEQAPKHEEETYSLSRVHSRSSLRSVKSSKSTKSTKSTKSHSSSSGCTCDDEGNGLARSVKLAPLPSCKCFNWFKIKRPTLVNLPVELMDCIVEELDEKSLINFMKTCKSFNSLGSRHLYQRIWLWSTYRFAQLASRLQDRPDLAELVRELDLSKVELKTDDQGMLLAGWRDWKFRSEPLYYTSARQLRRGRRRSLAQRHAPSPSPSPSPSPLVSSEAYPILCSPHNHPHMSPLLQRNATSCDVPIGPVLRTVEFCKFLRVLDLSYLSLAVDYYIVRGPSQHKFVSDVPKLYNWSDDEIRTVNTGNLMEAIIQLDNLQELILRRAIWVTRKLIERFLDFSHSIKLGNMKFMDLRESGMVRAAPWTICGTPQDIEHALDGTTSI